MKRRELPQALFAIRQWDRPLRTCTRTNSLKTLELTSNLARPPAPTETGAGVSHFAKGKFCNVKLSPIKSAHSTFQISGGEKKFKRSSRHLIATLLTPSRRFTLQ